MAHAVFLRGVNVGGHKTFRPAAFAKSLPTLDVVNIGAAGTFVVRAAASQAALRAELTRELPVETEVMILRAREILEIVTGAPFPREASGRDVRRFVSVIARRPRKVVSFPIVHPAKGVWQVKLVGLHGKLVLSLHRRAAKATVYPNEVVEKALDVPATTRGWETILKIDGVLRGG